MQELQRTQATAPPAEPIARFGSLQRASNARPAIFRVNPGKPWLTIVETRFVHGYFEPRDLHRTQNSIGNPAEGPSIIYGVPGYTGAPTALLRGIDPLGKLCSKNRR